MDDGRVETGSARALSMAAEGGLNPPDAQSAADTEAFRTIMLRRDRLLASLTLSAGAGLLLALPFALREAREFFLPLTIALVICVALVPILEWLERRGVPSALASIMCIVGFLAAANVAIASIVVPATDFFRQLPNRIDRIESNLAPLMRLVSTLEKFVNRAVRTVSSVPVRHGAPSPVAPPTSMLELAATTAPTVIIQLVFGILIVFFFLSGWTGMRRQTITGRASFDGAMATARVIQDVVDDVSAYLSTITFINLVLGLVVAGILYLVGMPYPLMWGGIVALLNYIPYFGAIMAAGMLGVGGLMTFSNIWTALLPPALMYGCHLTEANVVTPLVLGRRLTISPLWILISLSFWGWVWGTAGALLAVPLLIIIQTVLGAAGKPDLAGFLFEHGTLTEKTGRPRRPFARTASDPETPPPAG